MNAVPVAELWVSVSADVNCAIAGLPPPKVVLGELLIHDEVEAQAFLERMVRAINYKRYPPYRQGRT